MILDKLLIFISFYLFLGVLGLHCCSWAFSSCGEWGLLCSCGAWLSHCDGFSSCRAQALGCVGFSSCVPGLWSTGAIVVARGLSCSAACGIFLGRDGIHVSCIGRWILYHWATRDGQNVFLGRNIDKSVTESWWLNGKEAACNAGHMGSISGSGRSPGEGHGNPLQYYCLENSMNRGAWWAIVHGL